MDSKLSPREVAGLREVGKLLSRGLDESIRDSLIRKGLVTHKLGGLVRTEKGQGWLRRNG